MPAVIAFISSMLMALPGKREGPLYDDDHLTG